MAAFKFTARIMKKRPLRSLLTILQVGLGVWIVAIILSLNFQTGGALDRVEGVFGDSLAKLSVCHRQESGDHSMVSFTSNFEPGDLLCLQESEHIETAFIYNGYWEPKIRVNGLVYQVAQGAETSAGYARGLDLKLTEGHFFTEIDQEQDNKVMVISEVISKQLFPGQSPLGKTVGFGRYGEESIYEIIGVYKAQSAWLEYFVSEPYFLVPIETQRFTEWSNTYSNIFVRSRPQEIHPAAADAQILLAHRATDGMQVEAEYFADSNRHVRESLFTMTVFLGAFAFVSILISAIGILSIMLVSVVERTKETGLRKALGASRAAILGQILNESLVFSILGGILGLLAAYFSAPPVLGLLAPNVTYRLTEIGGLHWGAALISLALAVGAGLIFGLYPALRAARMPAVEALREG